MYFLHALALPYSIIVCYRRLVLQSFTRPGRNDFSAPYKLCMLYINNCMTTENKVTFKKMNVKAFSLGVLILNQSLNSV